MNASVTSKHAHAPASKATAFKWLLKREFWENRGGFLWAPVVTGIIVVALTLIGSIIGIVKFMQVKNGSDFDMTINDAAEHARQLGAVGDGILLLGIWLALLVLAFVVFFYCLGNLHDDKRDRSILFWKSLPISDTAMVLSKAAWALLLAPLLALGIGVLIGLALWTIAAISMAITGLPGGISMFTASHPFHMVLGALSCIPLYALWALPAVGWLMFCSAWARSKPFLWAVLVPVLACVIISMMSLLGPDIPHDTLWYVVVYRGLLSVLPGSWSPLSIHNSQDFRGDAINSPSDLMNLVNLGNNWHLFATAELWIGVVVGIALLAAAIYVRRWRETE